MTIDVRDETLMALADDVLPSDEAMRLRALIAGSPELAERFAVFVESGFLLEGMAQAEVAPSIVQLDAGRLYASGRPLSQLSNSGAKRGPIALAASVALMIGLTGGALLDRIVQTSRSPERVDASTSPQAQMAIVGALNEAPSGAIIGFGQTGADVYGRIAMISSHLLSSGVLCRQYDVGLNRFDVPPQTLLSCKEADNAWRTRVVVFREAQSAFATATGPDDVAPLVEALGGGSSLTPAEEAALLRR